MLKSDIKLIDISRKLRKNSTEAERFLWKNLRNREFDGFKFRRQQQIGNYIVDFVNFEKKIVIELDGGHHDIVKSKDLEREENLKKQGFKILRFWNNDVFKNKKGVLEIIKNKIY